MYPSNKKEVEAQKIVAEQLNGRLAMLGIIAGIGAYLTCLLYTSPSPRDPWKSRMPSSA